MTETRSNPVDALLDCNDAFEALGASQPGDAAMLDRVIDNAVSAGPVSPVAVAGTKAGLSTTVWLAIVAVAVVVVAVVAWPGGEPRQHHAAVDASPEVAVAPAATDEVPATATEVFEASPTPAVPEVERATTESVPHSDSGAEAAPAAAASRPRPPPFSASQLLEQANRARRADEARRALALYGRLFKEYPRSREATTARVSAGRLSLDQGKAKAALTHFRRYLSAAPNGSLAEEATVGRAMALQRLGRVDIELQAWQGLLEQYPDTVHKSRAQRRISALSTETP